MIDSELKTEFTAAQKNRFRASNKAYHFFLVQKKWHNWQRAKHI